MVVFACALAFACSSSVLGQSDAAKPKPAKSGISIKKLRAQVEALRKEHENEERESSTKGREREDGLEYFESLLAYLAVRAFPNDFVNWNALDQAAAKRDRMSSYGPLTPTRWEFMGPQNLQPSSEFGGFGPWSISGRVSSAAYDPTNPSIMYAATSSGGPWKTTNGGLTWVPLGDNWQDLRVSCIVVSNQNPNLVLAGTGDWDGMMGVGHGIRRSTDGGSSWQIVGEAQLEGHSVRRIMIDPDDDRIVIAVTSRGSSIPGRVWRSTDSGNTWSPVISASAAWSDIVCTQRDATGRRTYFAGAGGKDPQLWKSYDKGATWLIAPHPMRSNIADGYICDLAASPASPTTLYMLGSSERKLWKSTDAGAHWLDISDGWASQGGQMQHTYDAYVSCSSVLGRDVLYVGGIDVVASPDGGETWQNLSESYSSPGNCHADQHDFIVSPFNGYSGLACHDGGLSATTYQPFVGASFSSLSPSIGNTELYFGDFTPGGVMLVGAQDNGTIGYNPQTDIWRIVTGGDGGASLVDPANPLVQYSTAQFFIGYGSWIGIFRTANAWQSWTLWSFAGTNDVPSWMGPIVMSPSDSGALYVGTNYLWRLHFPSGTFEKHLGDIPLSGSLGIASIGLNKLNPSYIYVGSGDGRLWMSVNSGSNWTSIKSGLDSIPNRGYTAIDVRADNPRDILVGLSGTDTTHLWRCFDTTSALRTWVDVSGTGASGLPDAPINSIERDPFDPVNVWYVGTDVGVFRTSDAGTTWANFTAPLGLPNVRINALHVRNNYLYAVTWGRGVWRLKLSDPSGMPALESLVIDPSTVVGGTPSHGTVTLSGPAPFGGATVVIGADNTVAMPPSSVTIPEGEVSASFDIDTTVVPTQTVVTLFAGLGASRVSDTLTVNPNGLVEISLDPPGVIGGNPSHGTVRIELPASSLGATITLQSSNPAVAQVPASVTIDYGATSAPFTITTAPTADDTVVTITATYGESQVQGDLTVNAPKLKSFALSRTSVVGGYPVTGTVTLTGTAPAGGVPVSLESSLPSVASVPSTVTVLAGGTTATFTVTTTPVLNDSPVDISASYRGVPITRLLQVRPQHVSSVSVTPNPAGGGNVIDGRVTLGGPANGNVTVQLQSNNLLAATVPASVVVPSGQTTAVFLVTTKSVSVVSTTMIFGVLGTSSAQTTLTVNPLALIGFTLSTGSAFERGVVTGTLTLNGRAPSTGAIITIVNSNSTAATMPASVTIPSGAISKTFTITCAAVTQTKSTTITAKRGSVNIQRNLTVTPINVQSVQVTPEIVTGGAPVNGVVHIAAPAPSGGCVVNLSSTNAAAATVPATITVPQGATSKTFTVTTKPVGQTVFVKIYAARGSSSLFYQLRVLPPEVSTFRLSTSTTRGGNRITGTVTLTGKAPTGGMVVHYNAFPNLANPLTTITVPAGSNTVTFTIQTNAVTTTTTLNITVNTLTVFKSAALTLTP